VPFTFWQPAPPTLIAVGVEACTPKQAWGDFSHDFKLPGWEVKVIDQVNSCREVGPKRDTDTAPRVGNEDSAEARAFGETS